MDLESLVQEIGISECGNMDNQITLETNNMATVNPESQFDDKFIVNLIDDMVNSPPSEQLYTNNPAIEIKDFSTINAADLCLNATAPEYAILGNLMPVMSPASPSPSEVSTASYESTFSPDSNYSSATPQPEVFVEHKRKRGRKPKSESGVSSPTSPKIKKVKAYENLQPYHDKEMERKRLNAINAKRHRDMQKQMKNSLQQQLNEVILERDALKKEVEMLQQREMKLSQQMETFKKQAFSLMSVFETGQ